MSARPAKSATVERVISAASGWPVMVINLALIAGALVAIVSTAINADGSNAGQVLFRIFGALGVEVFAIVMLAGYFTLQPNEARVLILFGHYHGTVRSSGFHWANPFYARSRGRGGSKSGAAEAGPRSAAQIWLAGGAGGPGLPTKLSLRAHNFNSQTLKVNDKRGNPVEIGAVVVWRVDNTAQAVFDVEDYASYVQVQSESAIRSIASRYAYDFGEEHELTLRGGADGVALALMDELQVRLAKAGVLVDEARLTHLAYAPEIAPIMLRRQQAEATIAARQMIVHNAVSMVHMALRELSDQGIVALDDERKAAMVSNLLVVLCGMSEATPVINTGTLYT